MRTARSDLNIVQRIAVERGTRSQSGRLWRACQGLQGLAPPGSWKKIWEEVLSLSICLSTHLSHTTESSTLSKIKCERYIFIKKCFVRSLKFVNYIWLCLITIQHYLFNHFEQVDIYLQYKLIKARWRCCFLRLVLRTDEIPYPSALGWIEPQMFFYKGGFGIE